MDDAAGGPGVSIPNGLPRPFRQALEHILDGGWIVSIPNGLPRPFRLECDAQEFPTANKFQSLTGFPGHSDPGSRPCGPR